MNTTLKDFDSSGINEIKQKNNGISSIQHQESNEE